MHLTGRLSPRGCYTGEMPSSDGGSTPIDQFERERSAMLGAAAPSPSSIVNPLLLS